MPNWWDTIPANWWDTIPPAGQGPGVIPKQPVPPFQRGETNPLVNALMREPSIPNPSNPPVWARQAMVDMVRPVLDAGQWLGGVMAGNVQPTLGDAVTNLGGAALAGITPPGARGAASLEGITSKQLRGLASQELASHMTNLDSGLEKALKGVDVNGPVYPMDMHLAYENMKDRLPENVRSIWETREKVNVEIDRRIENIEKQLGKELKGTDLHPMDVMMSPEMYDNLSPAVKKLVAERETLVGP